MANLFKKATEKAPAKKTAKKDEKILVNVEGSEFAEKLAKFANLKAQMDELEADLAMSKEFVKNVGVEEYVKLIEKNKVNPGSFLVASEKGGRVMILPVKKYKMIDSATAENLTETYGEGVIKETTTFGFNNDILMRNMDAISDLIMNSEVLTDDDKENLIEAKSTFAVESDTLDKVYTLSKESGRSVIEVIEDFAPQFQLKNAKA